jgi:MoaA/NifB/PqqE/SkfB family radical SAM enzyme
MCECLHIMMKIFRPEHFGGVLYDTDTLRFELISETKTDADIIMESAVPKRTDILSAPVRAYFELTRICNLACRHCFVSSSPSAPRGASTLKQKKIIDQLVKNRVIDVRFTGGELTRRHSWFDVLNYAKDLGLVISMNTNGVYDNIDTVVNQIASLNPHQVTISIDGNRENHDYMRGKGSYDRSLKAIELMSGAGIKLRINTVITRLNVRDIPGIVDLASKYVREVNFFHMRPVGRGIKQNIHSLDYLEHFQSAQDTLALRELYPYLNIMHFEQSYRERSISKKKVSSLEDSFSHGATTINIDCFGGVWPNGYNTYQDKRLLLGNLIEDRLEDIWHDNEKLDALREWYKAVLNKCNSCNEYMSRCPGLSPEMEIARLSQGVKNNFCVSASPMPDLFELFNNKYSTRQI